ncbi:MAG: hypothetical protein WCK03_00880, partial [Candidatus Taylorbacteria bacterium]
LYRNFGKKSMKEIKEKLLHRCLSLGTRCVVGPLEREAATQGPFYPYVHWKAVRPLEASGIVNLNDLISKTEDEVVSMLKDCDPEEIRDPRLVYHNMRKALKQRGLI